MLYNKQGLDITTLKIKIFKGLVSDTEEHINNWLKDNNMNILFIKQSATKYDIQISIFYTENK